MNNVKKVLHEQAISLKKAESYRLKKKQQNKTRPKKLQQLRMNLLFITSDLLRE